MTQPLIPLHPLGENPLRSTLEAAVTKMSDRPEFLSECEVGNGLPIFRISTMRTVLSTVTSDCHAPSTIGSFNSLFRQFANVGCPYSGGVPLDACERVLMNGIDVLPTDSVIYANDLEKASEYGGRDKLIMILNQTKMRRSYMLLDEGADPETRRRVEQEYGTEPIIFPEGTIWYSRLAPTDRRRGSPYEEENGWYIPGDPFSVLSGIIICSSQRTAESPYKSPGG